MVRSVDLYSFYIVYARLLDRTRGTLVSRDPANARDVPAGPLVLVAPQSKKINPAGALEPTWTGIGTYFTVCFTESGP